MTPENRRLNTRSEWQLGEEAWREAEVLRSAEAWRGAVSRYYYAAFHCARAALLSRGEEPSTHAGVANRFAELFVRSGLLEGRLSRLLGRSQRDREQADYARAVIFSETDAVEAAREVGEFRDAVAELLRSEGWLADTDT